MRIILSSFKRDHGIKELLSQNENLFWHTDDNLPHLLQLSFPRKTYISHVMLQLKFSRDESYTPQEIEIRCGETRDNMIIVNNYIFKEPDGYVRLDIDRKCFYVYIIIKANHQDGRDSHVRNVKVYGFDGVEILPEVID
ncbi:Anaphase-promoting complex subunit 10 [Dictyocoela muelleri]|nr:Anaphase-promoting complex subunit 10 [Dictyocoela muelleri]